MNFISEWISGNLRAVPVFDRKRGGESLFADVTDFTGNQRYKFLLKLDPRGFMVFYSQFQHSELVVMVTESYKESIKVTNFSRLS